MKFPSWHHRAGKDQKMSVRVSTQGEKMPSGRALLISLCDCLLHLSVDQVYLKKIIYFEINKYGHLTLKNISFYETDDFSFLYFFEKKKKYRHMLTNCTWETVVWDFCMVKSLPLTWNTFIFTSRCNYYKCPLILL